MCAYLVSQWICWNHIRYHVFTKTIECNLTLCCVWFHITTRRHVFKAKSIVNLKKIGTLVFDGCTFASVSFAETKLDVDLHKSSFSNFKYHNSSISRRGKKTKPKRKLKYAIIFTKSRSSKITVISTNLK